MRQPYKIMKRVGPYGAWYDIIPAVAVYKWWTSEDLPTSPPPQQATTTQGYNQVGLGYDPTQLKLPEMPKDPEAEKWPSWVFPVALTVGGLLIAGASVYIAKKLDKKKSVGPRPIYKVNPRRKRK